MEHHLKRLPSHLRTPVSRRSVLKGAAATAGAVALTGHGLRTLAQDAEPTPGGTFLIGMEAESDVLDPHVACCGLTYRVNSQLYEGLVAEDLTLKDVPFPPLIPRLAESYEVSPDGTTYTFKLRPNVAFHDGTPWNADAAKYNFDRIANPEAPHFNQKANAFCHYAVQFITSTEVVDPMTFRITMSQPFNDFLRLTTMSCGEVVMISPEAHKRLGDDGIANQAVGTGPFKFVERVMGEKIVMERNEAYHGQKPYLDRLIWRPLPDATARVAALERGDIDFLMVPHPDSVPQLRDKGFIVDTQEYPHVWYISLNMREPILQDVRVRRALHMAIDKEGMAADLLQGVAQRANSLLPPRCPAFDPNFQGYPYDPEQAKALLAEARVAEGTEIVYQTSVSGSGQISPVPMMEWIQQDYAKIGLKLRIESYEWLAYLREWGAGSKPGTHALQQSWGMSANYWLGMVTHSKNQAPNGSNTGWYANPDVDGLIDRAIAAVTEEESIALWRQAHQLIMDDAAIIPVVHDLNPMVYHDRVKGFILPPEWWFTFSTVWLEQ